MDYTDVHLTSENSFHYKRNAAWVDEQYGDTTVMRKGIAV